MTNKLTVSSRLQLASFRALVTSTKSLSSFFETEEAFLAFRRSAVTWLMGNDPAILNITVTSDIIKYNALEYNERAVMAGNMIKSVSDRQSFVYNPHN